jgi:LPXTG-motif cell wall-anchored protein
VPYINFTIVPLGFTSSGPATLTFFDVNGNFVEQVVSPTLSGQVVYPGAVAGPDGEGLDWPGWTLAPNGFWIQDPSDAVLREGLTIQVEVNPTATTTVSYVPSDSVCANPPRTSPPTTTIACVPGQNNDGTPDDDCKLARTGGGVGNALAIAGAAVVAGLVFLAAARRRRRAVSSS